MYKNLISFFLFSMMKAAENIQLFVSKQTNYVIVAEGSNKSRIPLFLCSLVLLMFALVEVENIIFITFPIF